MAKVFISHRTNDLEKAKQLAEEIRIAGHEVWLDVWKIHPGDSIVEKINEGLENAEYVLLCLSSEGVSSPWISREWMSTLSRQIESKGVKLIPIRLSGKKLPSIISDIKYVDLMSDWPKGIIDLLRAIK